MGLLTDRDANTPVKGGFAKVGKLFKNTAKAPRSQYDAMAPSTPIASSESPAQQAAPSPEPLLGSVSLVFEKPCKLGATFQETPGRLALRVIAYALDSQAREMGVKVRAAERAAAAAVGCLRAGAACTATAPAAMLR